MGFRDIYLANTNEVGNTRRCSGLCTGYNLRPLQAVSLTLRNSDPSARAVNVLLSSHLSFVVPYILIQSARIELYCNYCNEK